MIRHWYIYCFFFVYVFALCAYAQEDAATVLVSAKKLYLENRYDETITVLQKFVRANGKDPANEQIIPLLCEALIRKGDMVTTLKLYDLYKKKYAQSPFIARMHYCAGYAANKQNNPSLALTSFSLCLFVGATPQLDSLCLLSAFGVCNAIYLQGSFDNIRTMNSLHVYIREIVDYFDILRNKQNDRGNRLSELIVSFKQRYPQSAFRLPEATEIESDKAITLGLLAPLSGADGDIGRVVLQGATIALDQLSASKNSSLKLIPYDTKSSPLECARKTTELLTADKVKIILGPMLSADAVISASILACNNSAIMLSPTATDDGIADLSSAVFLVNTTIGSIGTSLARYAVQNLTIKEFAIVAPSSEYGLALSTAFKQEALRLGATIIAVESYTEGTTDFKAQFESIRSQIFYARYGKDKISSGKLRKADSLYLADTTISLGGLFIPAEAGDAVMIAAQSFYHKIRTQMLGGNGWHSQKLLTDGRDYVNNALFATAYPAATSERSSAFKSAYKAKYKVDPDRIAGLGYDAVMLVADALLASGGKADPARLAKALLNVRDYAGVAGQVSFSGKNGANQAAAIMKISNKQFVPIQ